MTNEEAIKQLEWYFEEDNGISADLLTKQAFNTIKEALNINVKESNFRKKARLSMLESCYLNQGITQC